MAYSVSVYSRNWRENFGSDGTLLRTLSDATQIMIREKINIPNTITFRVPKESDDADALEMGRIVVITDGSDTISSGIILQTLDKTQDLIPVTALTKEELLNWAITPEEFSLESDTAAAQIRELLQNYRSFRKNTEALFNEGSYSGTEYETLAISTDADADISFILLTETNDEYETTGTHTYTSTPILCTDATYGSPEDFARLRYRARLSNDTEITAAFRYSNDAATGTPSNWSAWSMEHDLSSEVGNEGGERLGITDYSISADFRWVQVRFTFSTMDSAITPALESFEVVCSYAGEISEGSIDLDGAALDRYFDFEPHQGAIQMIVTSLNSEYRVNDDFTLDIAPQFGDATPSVTLTVGTNCNVIQFTQGDRRLSTEIWSLGAGQGLAKTLTINCAEDEIEVYGARPWLYRPSAEAEADRATEIEEELDKRKVPTKNVVVEEITAVPLGIEIGDVVNFVDEYRGITASDPLALRVVGIGVADPRTGTPPRFELLTDEGFFPSELPPQPAVSGASGASGDETVDTLSWNPIPPLNVFVDADGNFSGNILNDVDEYLDNPSGADITFSIASKSSAINSATLDPTTYDLSVSITGVVGNSLNNTVNVRAEGTIDGTDTTVDFPINIDLIYSTASDAEAGATGVTGETGPAPTLTDTADGVQISSGGSTLTINDGEQGDTGNAGADSTVAGPKGDTGNDGTDSTVAGPKGDTGNDGTDSTVAGPKGDTGSDGTDSTVAGPKGDTGSDGTDSTVAGPKGDTGSDGTDSTVAGPKGDTGSDGTDSTVAGPKGDTGSDGTDSTVAGPKGDTGNDGTDSTVAGPKGDTGSDGADSTVAGPKGDTGNDGADSTVAGSTRRYWRWGYR